MLEIISEANKSNKTIIVDESFIDFADKDKRYTLIDHTILQKYKNYESGRKRLKKQSICDMI